MTTTRRASRCARGTTPTPRRRWSRGWSTTLGRSSTPLDGVELDDEQADAVGLLALVAGQDVEPGDDDGTWRIAQRVAPDRVISTVDPEARHMHKTRSASTATATRPTSRSNPRPGSSPPRALTPANAGDGPTGVGLLDGEEPGLQVLADSAYGSGEVRAALAPPATPRRSKPIPLRRRRARRRFDRDDFIIDHHARTVTCPAGHTVHDHAAKATPPSAPAAAAARSATAAPPPTTDAPCTSATTTPSSSTPAAPGATATSPTTTDNGDRWSNAPSPGSSPTATAASATAASNATNSASPPASPPSTSADSSTSASTHDRTGWTLT